MPDQIPNPAPTTPPAIPPAPTDIPIRPGSSYPLPGNADWSVVIDPDGSAHLRKTAGPASILDLIPAAHAAPHAASTWTGVASAILVAVALLFVGFEAHRLLPHLLPGPAPAPPAPPAPPTPPQPVPDPHWQGAPPIPSARPLGTSRPPAEPRAVTATLPLGGDRDCPCGDGCPCADKAKGEPEPPMPPATPMVLTDGAMISVGTRRWRPIGNGIEAYCELNPDGRWYYQFGNPAVVRSSAGYVPPVAAVPAAMAPVLLCPAGGCR